jgi:hypothetical protein
VTITFPLNLWKIKMDNKLESRIARLEKLLSDNKSVKNEDHIDESNKLANRVAKALKRARYRCSNRYL